MSDELDTAANADPWTPKSGAVLPWWQYATPDRIHAMDALEFAKSAGSALWRSMMTKGPEAPSAVIDSAVRARIDNPTAGMMPDENPDQGPVGPMGPQGPQAPPLPGSNVRSGDAGDYYNPLEDANGELNWDMDPMPTNGGSVGPAGPQGPSPLESSFDVGGFLHRIFPNGWGHVANPTDAQNAELQQAAAQAGITPAGVMDERRLPIAAAGLGGGGSALSQLLGLGGSYAAPKAVNAGLDTADKVLPDTGVGGAVKTAIDNPYVRGAIDTAAGVGGFMAGAGAEPTVRGIGEALNRPTSLRPGEATMGASIVPGVGPGESPSAGIVPVDPSTIKFRPDLFQQRDVPAGSPFDPARVAEIAQNWDPKLLDPVNLVRDTSTGDLVVTSGNHRVGAAQVREEASIPARITSMDLSDPAQLRQAQGDAALSNFLTKQQNIREQYRGLSAAVSSGRTPEEISSLTGITPSRIQRVLDVGNAGPQVLERAVTDPQLEPIAAAVGAARRTWGFNDEASGGWFNDFVGEGKGRTLPSTSAIQDTLDTYYRIARDAGVQQGDLFGAGQLEGMGADPVRQLAVERAQLQTNLERDATRLKQEQLRLQQSVARFPGDEDVANAGQVVLERLRGEATQLQDRIAGMDRAAAEEIRGRMATPTQGGMLGQADQPTYRPENTPTEQQAGLGIGSGEQPVETAGPMLARTQEGVAVAGESQQPPLARTSTTGTEAAGDSSPATGAAAPPRTSPAAIEAQLGIVHDRAQGMLDTLERQGVVGPADEHGVRAVLDARRYVETIPPDTTASVRQPTLEGVRGLEGEPGNAQPPATPANTMQPSLGDLRAPTPPVRAEPTAADLGGAAPEPLTEQPTPEAIASGQMGSGNGGGQPPREPPPEEGQQPFGDEQLPGGAARANNVAGDVLARFQQAKPGLTLPEKVAHIAVALKNEVVKQRGGRDSGPLFDKQITPIMRQIPETERALAQQANEITYAARKATGILRSDKQGMVPLLDGTKVDVSDVAQKYSQYEDRLTPPQQQAIKDLAAQFEPYRQLGASLGRPVDTALGEYYIPRGHGEGGIRPVASGPSALAHGVSAEQERFFPTAEAGRAAGMEYGSLASRVQSTAREMGKALADQHAANQLAQVRDETGALIFHGGVSSPRLGSVDVAGLQGKVADLRYTNIVNRALDPHPGIATAIRVANNTLMPARVLFDNAYMGRLVTGRNLWSDPGATVQGVRTSVSQIFHPDAVANAHAALDEVAAAHPEVPGLSVRQMVADGAQIPLTGESAFGRAKSTLAAYQSTVIPQMVQNRLLDLHEAGVELTPEVRRQVTSYANQAAGRATQQIPGVQQLAMFPNWFTSELQFLGNAAAKGNITGDYARKAILKTVAVGVSATVAGNVVQGKDTPVINGIPYLHVPGSNDLIALTGTDYKLASQLAGAALNIPRTNVHIDTTADKPFGSVSLTGTNTYGEGAGMQAALKQTSAGAMMAGILGAAHGNPAILLRSKSVLPIGIGWDLFSGADLSGHKVAANDPGYWWRALGPMNTTGLGDRGVLANVGGALGQQVREPSPYERQGALQDQVAGTYASGKQWADLNPQQQQEALAKSPELASQIQASHAEDVASRGGPVGNALRAQQQIDATRITNEGTLGQRLRSGQDNVTSFKNGLDQLQATAVAAKAQANADFKVFQDSYDPRTGVGKLPDDPNRRALVEYYGTWKQAETAPGSRQYDQELLNQLQASLEARLTPTQKAFIANQADTPHSTDPAVQSFYDNKKYIRDAGYYALSDSAYSRVREFIDKQGTSTPVHLPATYGQLQIDARQAALAHDTKTANTLDAIITRVDKLAGIEKAAARRKDPALDQALVENSGLVPIRNQGSTSGNPLESPLNGSALTSPLSSRSALASPIGR